MIEKKKCPYCGEEILETAKKSKKSICFLLCIVLLYSCTSFLSNTELVKDAIYEEDYSISIGDALDNYKYFTRTEWKEFTTEQGRDIVEFRGFYFKNDVMVRIQFILNKDLQEDTEGANFRIGYQCYSYVTYDGEKKEVKNSYLIEKIYKNKEIQQLSYENLRKY